MSRVRLLLQKRPGFGPMAILAHIGIVIVLSIRYMRWCPYSHAELQIDGVCYSSTTYSGVRSANIMPEGHTWDIFDAPNIDADDAFRRFQSIDPLGYDWLGAAWWALPFARQRKGSMTCFESVALMMGMPEPHKQGPRELIRFVESGGK